jgi:hypothetical protein
MQIKRTFQESLWTTFTVQTEIWLITGSFMPHQGTSITLGHSQASSRVAGTSETLSFRRMWRN